MSENDRDAIYEIAAMLADLHRVLSPLAPGETGAFTVHLHPEGPLPPTSTPTTAEGARSPARSVREWTAKADPSSDASAPEVWSDLASRPTSDGLSEQDELGHSTAVTQTGTPEGSDRASHGSPSRLAVAEVFDFASPASAGTETSHQAAKRTAHAEATPGKAAAAMPLQGELPTDLETAPPADRLDPPLRAGRASTSASALDDHPDEGPTTGVEPPGSLEPEDVVVSDRAEVRSAEGPMVRTPEVEERHAGAGADLQQRIDAALAAIHEVEEPTPLAQFDRTQTAMPTVHSASAEDPAKTTDNEDSQAGFSNPSPQTADDPAYEAAGLPEEGSIDDELTFTGYAPASGGRGSLITYRGRPVTSLTAKERRTLEKKLRGEFLDRSLRRLR